MLIPATKCILRQILGPTKTEKLRIVCRGFVLEASADAISIGRDDARMQMDIFPYGQNGPGKEVIFTQCEE